MTGEYQHTLDAKGRLFIPARLREELGPEFYVTISADTCLYVYSTESWRVFSEKAAQLPTVQKRKTRVLFAFAAKCEPDAQGRILIPQKLREHAHLVKNVTVLGVNDHAELWASEEWDELRDFEASPENIMAALEELEL